MLKIKSLFIAAFLIIASSNLAFSTNFDEMVKRMDESFAKVNDYTCSLCKNELIGDKYVAENNVTYKYMKKDNYYLKWNEGSKKGTEVLYSGAKYEYKILAHLGGVLNVINKKIDPKGSTAMKDSRHSILDSDLGFLIRTVKSNYYKAKAANEITIKELGEFNMQGVKVIGSKALFPANKGYYGAVIELYVDKNLNLPIKLVVTDWNGKLIESYYMAKLKINVGLGKYDFDEENENYGF